MAKQHPKPTMPVPNHAATSPALSEQVRTYTRAAQAAATHKSYRVDLNHFRQYGGTIPATGEQLAEYLAKFAGVQAVATLQHRLIAIHRAHVDQGLASPVMAPLVKRTMQGIRRTYGVAQRRVRALVKDDIVEMTMMIDQQKPLKAARDKALTLIGFAGAFRRSELVAIRYEDITHFDTGIEILLRKSKTDQEGHGRTVFIPHAKSERCPVKALQHLLTLAQIDQGPVFRRINRHDKPMGKDALTPQSVALIVKSAVTRARGADAAQSVAGHSLRSGYCTEAASVGIPAHLIMEQTGHTSSVTLAKYIRPVMKRKIPSLL